MDRTIKETTHGVDLSLAPVHAWVHSYLKSKCYVTDSTALLLLSV